ncbi:MAG: response regulator [Elusimicrobiota bacterium]|nr:response regulator [Elusimicrobiota bacterium]
MRGASVLVVDDDAPSLEIVARMLESKGHRVTLALSAERARAVLAALPFDAVLLDHVLPGATGTQCLREFRALTKAPLYIMSGYTDPEFQRDALLLGASGFLPKPLDFAALGALLEALPG